MIKLYTNRTLSEKLGIGLAKWKRWSREFLPPDPLGGMQSGFARQYYFRDAFQVMLGGHLVGQLHYSIHEARHIMESLNTWLSTKGFFTEPSQLPEGEPLGFPVIQYKISIQQWYVGEKKCTDFLIIIRGIIFNKLVSHDGMEAKEERYIETVMDMAGHRQSERGFMVEKILDINNLYRFFIEKMGYIKVEN